MLIQLSVALAKKCQLQSRLPPPNQRGSPQKELHLFASNSTPQIIIPQRSIRNKGSHRGLLAPDALKPSVKLPAIAEGEMTITLR
jgi:hypothetical protein